jgi:C-terminal peptidase prc
MKKFALLPILFLVISCQPSGKSNIHMQSFEAVWQTVNEKHYDPDFGGLDWQEVHDRYRPMFTRIKEGLEFRSTINEMLFELGLSHLLVASEADLKMFLPDLFADAGIGVDMELIAGKAVLRTVDPSSPADRAGLRAGFVLEKVDAVSVQEIAAQVDEKRFPPLNNRHRRGNITNMLLGRIYGQAGTSVSLTFRDEKGRSYTKEIVRKTRGQGRVMAEVMPPFFIEFEARRLGNKMGYIRFNHFANPVDQDFILALESMRDAPGIIIDLRGTSGGFLSTMDTMARYLLKKEALFYTFKMRNENVEKVLTPAQNAYTGPLALIINERSLSCGEIFASSLKALGRAVIVGERSPGYSLIANWIKLSNGDAFMHTIALNRTPDGRILEDNGAVPDIQVNLNVRKLLDGIDTQLQAAVDHLQGGQ